jgi:hypothetical protein
MRPTFFGIIGPNVKTACSLFSLMTSNGILQGVFLNDTTSVSHLIQTSRVRRPWFPHHGVANTAVLSVRDKDYAMFERDLPYEIAIDYPTVRTIGRISCPFPSLCAHSTFEDPLIHSMTYSILYRTVSFLTLGIDFAPLRVETVRTTYIPLVHSYLRHAGTYVFSESPLCLRWKWFPVYLNPLGRTVIHVVPEKYTADGAFFIFHYGPFSENATAYTLYAPAYDSLAFEGMNISGKYRRFILDKVSKTVIVEKNPELELYNLDFPLVWRGFVLLRNLNVDHINGFVLCDGLEIVRTYWLNVSVLGEPYIHEDTLYALTAESLLEMNMVSGEVRMSPVSIPGTLGFHAFIKFKYNMSNSNTGSS